MSYVIYAMGIKGYINTDEKERRGREKKKDRGD